MAKLIFHGGAQQIGRSCIEIATQGDRYLLDCGIGFLDDGFEYPEGVFKVKELDGVLLSHAHLDHSGALPFMEHLNLLCPVFMSSQTKPIIKILLKDSYKIARIKNTHPAYAKPDLKKVQKGIRLVQFDKRYHFRKIHFTYRNAGHIPGSAMINVEVEGKHILYTGDYNTRKNNLVEPANSRAVGPVDVLITEATYGNRQLPIRKTHELEFLKEISRIIDQGGRVVIPVFALGRTQEILIMLSRKKWKVPIYLDGMGKQLTRKILMTPSKYVINKDALNQMYFERCVFVTSQQKRNEFANKPGIFVTTSGMVQGGPAIHYIKHMWHDPKSAIFLTGYQIPHTNGWLLANRGEIYIKGWKTKVKCYVRKFSFSGHLDQDDLHQFILDVNPPKLIIQHGDPDSCRDLAKWARANTDCTIHVPKIGDEIEV